MNLTAFYYIKGFESHHTVTHPICPYLDLPRELPLTLIGDAHADYGKEDFIVLTLSAETICKFILK